MRGPDLAGDDNRRRTSGATHGAGHVPEVMPEEGLGALPLRTIEDLPQRGSVVSGQ